MDIIAYLFSANVECLIAKHVQSQPRNGTTEHRPNVRSAEHN